MVIDSIAFLYHFIRSQRFRHRIGITCGWIITIIFTIMIIIIALKQHRSIGVIVIVVVINAKSVALARPLFAVPQNDIHHFRCAQISFYFLFFVLFDSFCGLFSAKIGSVWPLADRWWWCAIYQWCAENDDVNHGPVFRIYKWNCRIPFLLSKKAVTQPQQQPWIRLDRRSHTQNKNSPNKFISLLFETNLFHRFLQLEFT